MNWWLSGAIISLIVFQTLALSVESSGRQIGDMSFIYAVKDPAYNKGEGPLVLIDEAHQNFHTSTGRYRAFADLLRQDGYTVKAIESKFAQRTRQKVDVLVIANALHERNVGKWSLPSLSAFDKAEIDAIQSWVGSGGSLFLIADHMPFPGAVSDLARRFGFLLSNGFALKSNDTSPMQFRKSDGTLQNHPIVNGRNPSETVIFVSSFTGQAFRVRPGNEVLPILTLADDTWLLLPIEAWQFSDKTPAISAAGMLQGAVTKYGKGRVAMFGEAAMFTAQSAGANQQPMGMNHPDAPYNAQFVLNILHWLSGLLPYK